MTRARRAALPIFMIGVALATYLATAARAVLGGDNGEFAALSAAGGVAHPPGYPLYVLWLRALSFLPATSPAHRAALATAFLGAGAVGCVYAACRAWGAGAGAACVTAAAFAFSPRMWIAATHAEVFALNALIGAAILAVVGTERMRGAARVAALGALAGCGLSNHHSIVLLAPIGLYGVARGLGEAPVRSRAAGLGLATFAAGLLPYAYTVYVSRHPSGHVLWGDAGSLRGFLFHVRRGEYGTTSLTPRPTAHRPFAQLLFLGEHLLRDLLGLPLLAAFALRRRPSAGVIATLASFALAGPLFVLLFPLDVRGLDGAIVERFHLLPAVVLAVLTARGLELAWPRVLANGRAAAALSAGFGGAAAMLSLDEVRAHHRDDVERWMYDSLASARTNAVVLGTGDHRLGAFLYARAALGLRPDVEYVDAMLLLDETYRRRASAKLGVELPAPVERTLSTEAVARAILARGRPLFLTNAFAPAIVRTFPTYPIGTLIRVLPEGAAPPPPPALFRENGELFARFVVAADKPRVDTWQGELRAAYTRPWSALERVFREAAEPMLAGACAARVKAVSAEGAP